MNVFPKWLAIFWIGSVLVLVIGGAWFHADERQRALAAAESQLEAIGRLKTEQISKWRADLLNEARAIMDRETFPERFLEWKKGSEDQALRQLSPSLGRLKEREGYSDILLVDASGEVILSLAGEERTLGEEALRSLRRAFQEKGPILTSLYSHPHDGVPHIDAIAPFFATIRGASEPVGAVVFETDAADSLYPTLQSWPLPSKTGGAYLVRLDGDSVLFLSDVRHQEETALQLRIPLTQTDNTAVQAATRHEGTIMGRDYRGVNVLSSLHPVQDSTWFLLAEIDEEEALANWRKTSSLIQISILGFLLLAILSAGLIWQHGAKRSYRSLHQSEVERREGEEKYRQILDSLLEGCLVIGYNWRYLYVNRAGAAHNGKETEDLLGLTLMEAFPGFEETQVFKVLNLCMDKREPCLIENEFHYPDGTSRWFELSIQPVPDGLFVLSKDVTERKAPADKAV